MTCTLSSSIKPDTYTYGRCSSDVCSSDLNEDLAVTFSAVDVSGKPSSIVTLSAPNKAAASSVTIAMLANANTTSNNPDRKSVVTGKTAEYRGSRHIPMRFQ